MPFSLGGHVQQSIRVTTVMCALIAGLVLGCKQKPKEETEPTVATPPPTAATATATAASATPPPEETIPPPVPPPVQPAAAPKPAKAESIAPCCSALHKEATEASKDKGLYQSAAGSCDAIAKLVSAGTTKKAAALTQLRANLRGAKLPAGCE
jgi:hypothetical protein